MMFGSRIGNLLGSEGINPFYRVLFLAIGFSLLFVSNTMMNEIRHLGRNAISVQAYVDDVRSDRRGTWVNINYTINSITHDLIVDQRESRSLRALTPGDRIALLVNSRQPGDAVIDSADISNRARLLVVIGVLLLVGAVLPRPWFSALVQPRN